MIQLELNPRGYVEVFVIRASTALADLRALLRARESATFAAQATPSASSVIKMTFGPVAQNDLARLCNRTFVTMIAEFVTLLDRLIAMDRFRGRELRVDTPFADAESAAEYAADLVEAEYNRVASDQSLTNPKKLAYFSGLSDFVREAVGSYFRVRRYIEHRDALADEDTTLLTRRLATFAGEQEITTLPFMAPENTGISLKAVDARRLLPAKAPIEIAEAEIESILWTLQFVAAEEILAGLLAASRAARQSPDSQP